MEIKNKTKPRMKAMGSYAVSENWAEVRMEITEETGRKLGEKESCLQNSERTQDKDNSIKLIFRSGIESLNCVSYEASPILVTLTTGFKRVS